MKKHNYDSFTTTNGKEDEYSLRDDLNKALNSARDSITANAISPEEKKFANILIEKIEKIKNVLREEKSCPIAYLAYPLKELVTNIPENEILVYEGMTTGNFELLKKAATFVSDLEKELIKEGIII